MDDRPDGMARISFEPTYEILAEHTENGVRVIDEIKLHSMSVVRSSAEILPSYTRLNEYKAEIISMLQMGDTIMMAIAKKVEEIAEAELFRAENNPHTERPYASMKEYLPHLLEELRTRARLHKLSKRQVQEYISLYKVFVKNLGVGEEEIMRIGPTHFTEVREALDYDRETGAPKHDSEARPGKIGAETALRYVEELRESDGEIRVRDLREALDGERGVERSYLRVRWAHTGAVYWIADLSMVKGDRVINLTGDGNQYLYSIEDAKEANALLRAVSNIEEL